MGGLWYERIDQLIANQFLEYASFTNDQEKYVRQATLEFKYWNIKNELPKYKKLILDSQALKRQLKPNDVAQLVMFLASDQSSGCTKQSFIVDGGIT